MIQLLRYLIIPVVILGWCPLYAYCYDADPVVSITSPTNGAVYEDVGIVGLKIQATDSDGYVEKVELYDASGDFWMTKDSEPWKFVLSDLANGTYSFYVKAYDNDSNTAESATVTFIVDVNQVPVVTIVSPDDGSVFYNTAPINFQFSASDLDGTVTQIRLFDEDGEVVGETGSEPWEIILEPLDVGTYAYFAEIKDDELATSMSETVTIHVEEEPVNQAPTVAIMSPENGADFMEQEMINFLITTDDTDGLVVKVELFDADGNLYATKNSSPWQFGIDNIGLGTNYFYAIATDDAGAISQSTPISLTILEWPNEAPVVSLSHPIDGASYEVGQVISLQATANDPDGDILSVQFYINGQLHYTDESDPFQFDWTTSNPGDCSMYVVAMDDDGATASTEPVTISMMEVTATHEIKGNKVLLFPNPTKGFFNILIDKPTTVETIRIINAAGKELFEIPVEGRGIVSFDLEGYGSGVYFVHVESQETMETLRVTVE